MSEALDDEADAGPGYDPAGLRLRGRARLGGVAVALATVLPYEVVDGQPQFLWHLAGELGPAGLLAYLAPALAGLGIVAASFVVRRSATLALVVIGALAAAGVLIHLGADASAWDLVALPDAVGRSPLIPLLCLALTAAGSSLTFAERTRRAGQAVLIAAVVLAVGFYTWPGRGEAPIQAAVRLLGQVGDVPDWRFQLGFIIFAIILLWPALISLIGLVHLKIPAPDDQPLVGIVARYGLAALLGMLVFRGIPGAAQGWGTFHAIGAIVCLTGLVSLTAGALVVAIGTLAAPPGADAEADPRPAARRAGVFVLAAVVLVSGAQWVLARPPSKGVDWTLKAATPAGDALFSDTLMAWNRARLRWDRQARSASGAEALLAVKAAGRTLVDAAQAFDPSLAPAFERLTRESRDLGLAGRRWHRLVADVNEAIRAAGQPYYLDPTVLTLRGDGEARRHFRMRAYRVTRVRRFDVEGDAFATLHVDRIDGGTGASPLLGFSRDLQPFAIVLLPEIQSFQEELADGAAADPPTCLAGSGSDPNDEAEEIAADVCGKFLAKAVAELGAGLPAAAAAVVDRHELQHQIDGPVVPMAPLVAERLAHRGEEVRERVNRELSAYLAQLTADDAPPHLGAVQLARLAIGSRGRRIYPITGLLALEALTGHPTLLDSGPVGDGLAQALSEISADSPDALRARARAAWARQYGADLPAIVAQDVVSP
ncbi:MAG: hypothetical protein H6706_21665 [Myxococcales bacterium]|nr:hypothetical protein [Myxococcales bacterium]